MILKKIYAIKENDKKAELFTIIKPNNSKNYFFDNFCRFCHLSKEMAFRFL